MRELTIDELELVSGATMAGDIAMGVASAWAGLIVGTAVGGLPGGVIGFGVGVAISVGLASSGGTFGRDEQAGTDYSGCDYH